MPDWARKMTFNCFSIKSFWFTVTGLMSSQAMDLVCGLTQKNLFLSPAAESESGSGTSDQLVISENASFPRCILVLFLLEHSQVLSELEPTQMHFFQPGWPTCDYWNCNLSLAFRWSAAIRPNTAPACIWPLTTGSKFEWISIENHEKWCQLRAG